ncbi:hypothetical protein [Siminovitchia fordii]|uniref:Uncharacterized protein n=1 Tax=Siminovitchia fordii TaxID=254759 RepID=A0ABQ4K9Q4_9BACI|nr:hypothetical protein [Siminovitchia fordii]GIN22449.1 hypothetical protein J1TS3_35830 [Siminovitchia fordii]
MRKTIFVDVASIHNKCKGLSYTNKIVLVGIFSGLAAVFQSAGALFPGVGYIISPLATAPIIFCSIFSARLGFLSYVLTILILLFSHPSELIIFPFTTGLLGLAIGVGFLICGTYLTLNIMGCSALSLGILTVLYGLKFPLLGPLASTTPKLSMVVGIVIFSALYSWIWILAGKIMLKRMIRIIG